MPTLHTPSSNGTEFQFDIDANESIVITSQSSKKHRYHIDAINDLYLWSILRTGLVFYFSEITKVMISRGGFNETQVKRRV